MTIQEDHVDPLPPGVSARIREHVAKDLRPARGLSTLARLGGAALAAAAAASAGAMMSADAASAPLGALVIVVASVAMIAAATGFSMARASVPKRLVLALLPALAFYAVVLAARMLHVHEPGAASDAAVVCLVRGAMLAALPLAVLIVLWRRSDPFTPRLSGALLGGWAGLSGAVALTLACPSEDFWHVALGHGGALLGGAVLGAVLAPRWIRP
jgi:hypothetical protein